MSELSTAEDRTLSRVLFFSDAVFAIVLTLLVLELRVPEADGDQPMLDALLGQSSHFIAFGASFALIIIFWAAHVAIMRRLTVFDWPVAWSNAALLLIIALMPFASALLGEGRAFGIAWIVYSAILVAASVAQTILVLVTLRDGGRLVGGTTLREVLWRTSRSLSPGIAFAIGLALVFADLPSLSALCWALIPVIMLASNLLFGPRRAKAPEA